MNATRLRIKSALFRPPLAVADAARNLRHTRGDGRVLIVRHPGKNARHHRDFLRWVAAKVPDLHRRLEFHRLPHTVRDWSRYALHVSWAGDTYFHWSPKCFESALGLVEGCREHGVPVINSAEQLTNTVKSKAARLIGQAGVRTPRMVPISDWDTFRRNLAGFEFPLLVREDAGHGQQAALVSRRKELEALEPRAFQRPVAVEYIDTRSSADGLFRKYRLLAVGEAGIARHLIINDGWEVRPERRVKTDAARQEELDYLNGHDPNAEVLDRARRRLGLDVAGFDYSYDHEGRLVVWEANAYPDLSYPRTRWCRHIVPAVERSFAALARLYLERAGLETPAWLEGMVPRREDSGPEVRMAA